MIFKSNKNPDTKKINRICELYGIKMASYEKASINHDSYKIITDDSKTYYLKEIPKSDIIDKQNQISQELKNYNIKTYTIIKEKNGEISIKYLNRNYILISNVIGTKITNKDLSNYKILKECAKLLALLHMALKKIDLSNARELNTNELIKLYIHNNKEFIEKNKIESIMEIVENDLKNLSKNRSLNKQLIHGDFHTGNLLFNNDRADVVIDFDLSLKGDLYFDIAYFLQRILKNKRKIKLFLDEYKNNNPNLIKEKGQIYLHLLETELIVMNYYIGISEKKLVSKCINDFKYILENKNYYIELS